MKKRRIIWVIWPGFSGRFAAAYLSRVISNATARSGEEKRLLSRRKKDPDFIFIHLPENEAIAAAKRFSEIFPRARISLGAPERTKKEDKFPRLPVPITYGGLANHVIRYL